MNTRTGWIVVSALTLAIVVLAIALVLVPAPEETSPFESENVKVSTPLPNATVSRAFAVSGEARGNWFFEASFPIEVRDPSGTVVGHGIAQAGGEWMTTELVPFAGAVTVADYSGPGALVLVKDNPSGLPEHDDSVEFPIVVQ